MDVDGFVKVYEEFFEDCFVELDEISEMTIEQKRELLATAQKHIDAMLLLTDLPQSKQIEKETNAEIHRYLTIGIPAKGLGNFSEEETRDSIDFGQDPQLDK